jgi:hypothetical protein
MKAGDLYRSHKGHGDVLAQVQWIIGNRVHLRFINKTDPTRGYGGKKFALPIKYFFSPTCGWRLVDPESVVVPL